MTPCQGVTIHDMGHKMGCNGVDNGQLSFQHYAVPREALLNAFSEVAADGSFSSSIPKARDRFLKVRYMTCCMGFVRDNNTAAAILRCKCTAARVLLRLFVALGSCLSLAGHVAHWHTHQAIGLTEHLLLLPCRWQISCYQAASASPA
jgi:hypothetical protein